MAADDDGFPPWFTVLRQDFASLRAEMNEKLDQLVSRDTFRDEQRRVDEKIGAQGREISQLRTDLQSESQARVSAESNAQQMRLDEANKRLDVKRQTSWQWVAIFVGPIVTGFTVWFITSGGH